MSRQTTEARTERDYWRGQWSAHQQVCAACTQAARGRKARSMCVQGTQINQAHADAQTALNREIAADKAPIPGQEPLFLVKGG